MDLTPQRAQSSWLGENYNAISNDYVNITPKITDDVSYDAAYDVPVPLLGKTSQSNPMK